MHKRQLAINLERRLLGKRWCGLCEGRAYFYRTTPNLRQRYACDCLKEGYCCHCGTNDQPFSLMPKDQGISFDPGGIFKLMLICKACDNLIPVIEAEMRQRYVDLLLGELLDAQPERLR